MRKSIVLGMNKPLFRERSSLPLMLLLMFSAAIPARLNGQIPSGATVGPEAVAKADARVYAILFRTINRHRDMAQAAKSPDEPAAHPTTVLSQRLKLADFDAANLQRLSKEWAAELVPLQTRRKLAVEQLHQAKAETAFNGTSNPSPSAVLNSVQEQMNAVTLHYRDLWENTMPLAEFNRVQDELRKTYGTTGDSVGNSQTHQGEGKVK